MACRLIDKVSVLPHRLFLNPERQAEKEEGKPNNFAEVKMSCSEHDSRAGYPELEQKF